VKRLVAFALVCLSPCVLRAGALQQVEPERGHPVAPIRWMDDSGRGRQLSELAGYPVVLLPIYTRCRSACVENVAQLKKALADAKTDPREFRVLLFSFDDTDTSTALTSYRQREAVPLGWLIGRADQANIDALLQSVGFQYGRAGGEFMHPNLLLFLDSKMRVAKWIYGTAYSGRDVDAALRVALGQSDWVGRHSGVLYALLLFAAALLCVALFQQILRRKAVRAPAAPMQVAKS
jgi:cytochrome oxidase Cu insertion factor (SCO1/SenC/PrrC family)